MVNVKNRRRFRLVYATGVLVSISVVTTSYAAEALEEIVVTAQKRTENLQKVPISISAFSGDNLANASITDSTKLPQIVPGINIGNAGPFMEFYIRGVGTDNTTAAAESPTAVYIDGVYVADPSAMVMSMQNVERVEVLKGPQGTLYGRNATAGAVNIITAAPNKDFAAEASATGGNYGDSAFAGFINGGTDTLAANLAASSQRRSGTFDNYLTGGRLNSLDRFSTRGKLRWTPNEAVDLTLALDYSWENDTQQTGYQEAFPSTSTTTSTGQLFGGRVSSHPLSGYIDYPAIHQMIQRGANVTGRFHLTGFDIVSISAYRTFRLVGTQDIDGTDASVGGYMAYDLHDQASQELQLVSTAEGKWKWVGGLYFLHDRTGWDPLNYFAFQNIPIVGKVSGTSYAAFGDATYSFTDEWSVTGGVRYNHEQKNLYDISEFGVQTPTNEHSWQRITWKGVISWQRPEGLYYVSNSKGFKAGTYNIAAPDPVANKPVNPEDLVATEIGAKWTLGPSSRLNVSAFHYDYKNLQVQVFGQNAATLLENAASAKMNGAEAEFLQQISTGLQVHANVAYLSSKYSSFPNASVTNPNPAQSATNPVAFVDGVADLSGSTTPRAPKFSSTLGFDWRLPVGGAGHSIAVSGNWYHTSDFTLDDAGHIVVPSYSIASGNLAYVGPDDRWRVALWGNNLANAHFIVGAADVPFGRVVEYGDPRMYGVTVTMKFGAK